jgi:type IV pilus assembly protein PilE
MAMENASRNTTPRPAAAGFSLIELLVAVAIIGILAAIAIPSYVDKVQKSRRTDAKTALLDLASRQERFYTTNNTYTADPTATGLGYAVAAWPAGIPIGTQANYNLTVTAASATAYTAQAVPTGVQAGDPCGTYTINQSGVQGNTGNTLTTAQCW